MRLSAAATTRTNDDGDGKQEEIRSSPRHVLILLCVSTRDKGVELSYKMNTVADGKSGDTLTTYLKGKVGDPMSRRRASLNPH